MEPASLVAGAGRQLASVPLGRGITVIAAAVGWWPAASVGCYLAAGTGSGHH